MSESGGGNQGFGLGWMVALVAAALGVHWFQSSLSSSRPDLKAGIPNRRANEQPIPARLWQDPIGAIERADLRHWSSGGSGESSKRNEPQRNGVTVGELRTQIRKRRNEESPLDYEQKRRSVAVLIVPTTGRHYVENAESRIRSRFAVVSALGVADFAPEDPSGIGCLRLPCGGDNSLVASVSDVPRTENNDAAARVSYSTHHDGAECTADCAIPSLDIPYEWFRAKVHAPYTPLHSRLGGDNGGEHRSRFTNVLVLWVDEEFFGRDPLFRLAHLVNQITAELHQGGDDEWLAFRFLGPSDSMYLRKMVPWNSRYRNRPKQGAAPSTIVSSTGERKPTQQQNSSTTPPGASAEARYKEQIAGLLKNVGMYCWGATMVEELLVAEAPNSAEAVHRSSNGQQTLRELAEYGLRNVQLPLSNDGQLAGIVLNELRLRNVDPTDPKNHVVFISEWDTDWGRLVPLTFAARMRVEESSQEGQSITLRRAIQEIESKPPKRGWPAHFHFFSYLRGLDGKAVGDDLGSSPKGEGKGSDDQKRSPGGDFAAPFGPSQIDSIPRLSKRLRDLRTTLHYRNDGDVRAIGILGSDVFDKLLILQALRTYFPDLLVFTNELDARYWNPGDVRYGRNLLVASGFGLQLHRDLQGMVQPFRDSRQTALFNATLSSLWAPESTSGQHSYASQPEQPRLFEIANDGPVDISPGRESDRQGAKGLLHPPVRESPQLRHWAWWIAISGLTGWLGWCLLQRLLPSWRTDRPVSTRELEGALLLQPDDLANSAGLAACLFARISNDIELTKLQRELSQPSTELKAAAEHAATILDREPMVELPHQLKAELVCILNSCILDGRFEATGLSGRRKRLEDLSLACPKATGMSGTCSRYVQAVTPRYTYLRERIRTMQVISVMSGIAGVLLVISIAYSHFYSSTGEPFSVFGGVSTWPTDIILFVAVVFCAFGLAKGFFDLQGNALEIGIRYCLPVSHKNITPWPKAESKVRWFVRCLLLPRIADGTALFRPPRSNDGDIVWQEYLGRSHWRHSWLRISLATITFVLFGALLGVILGVPARPTRGPLNTWIDTGMFLAALLGSAVLTFFVVDASGRAQKLIRQITNWPVRWSSQTLSRVRRRKGLGENEIPEWLDVQIIAARTAAIDRLIYFPFVAISLIIVAHASIFDRFPWSPTIAALLAVDVAFALLATVQLTKSARTAREKAIKSLEFKRFTMLGRKDDQHRDISPGESAGAASNTRDLLRVNADLVDAAIEQLKALEEGAFRKLSQRPIFGASSCLGGATLFKLIDLWIK